MRDRPDGTEFAAGKALFVIPKMHPLDRPTDGAKEQERAQAAGKLFTVPLLCYYCTVIVFFWY